MQLRAIPSTHRQSSSVTQDRFIVTMKHRSNLATSIDVDDDRSVNSYEQLRIELRLQMPQSLATKIRNRADMEPHVLSLRFDPIDFIRFDQHPLVCKLHHHTVQDFDRRPLLNLLLCSKQGLLKA